MTNQESKSEPARVQPAVYKIFIASPGDVRDERMLARAVVEQIRVERAFRGRVDLECIAWDQPGVEVAMEAGLTPQEAIKRGLPKPSKCDLVIVILWSRMGTPLPADDTKPGGATYLSGTEWEFQDAITAAKRSGQPAVWLYRRSQVPQVAFDDPGFEEKRQQWDKVEAFFQGFVGENGSLSGGVNRYQTPDEFRRQFEQHLRDRLTVFLEGIRKPAPRAPLPQEAEIKDIGWTGSPYPGLEAFKTKQATIFFGRGLEVDKLIEVLRDNTVRFVAVVGASGSGKSSLVAAGLIPRLRAGALPGSDQWVDVTFKPGERGGDPFLALAYALKLALGTTGQGETELAENLRGKPALFTSWVDKLLDGRSQAALLLLVVDQFEELFTLASEVARERFIELIETIAELQKVRVIATMRADFTANVTEVPALAHLFQGRGIFLLPAPGVLGLTEMIRRPAQATGWEVGKDLCDRILTDTGTGPGALALMAFALHEVYDRGKQSGNLTLENYQSLGGVAGAIQVQAENALKRLGQTDPRVLHALFSNLVEVNDQGIATRRRAPLGEIRKDLPKANLADALVGARILVTDLEHGDNPTLEVAHEAVFSGWRRLSRWIDAHAGELRTCRSLSRAAWDWQEVGAPPFKHLPDRATVKQYRRVRPACALGKDAEVVKRFLGAARRRQWIWAGFLALVLLVVGTLGVDTWLRNREMNWNVARIWALSQFGYYAGPSMVKIVGDTFQMGAADCDPDSNSDKCPRHPVTIQTFWIGKHEITFDEYAAFVLDTDDLELPHDEDWGRGDRPVIAVSWDDARTYAQWLSEKTQKHYRLPTEAEWEYAARAGTITHYWWGNDPKADGKVWANCADCGSAWGGKRTMPVGSFPTNAFGLYDMHGNVWEWCQDWYGKGYYRQSPEKNPQGPDTGALRVIRGGSWSHDASHCRSATRGGIRPGDRDSYLGFRLSRSVVALDP